MVHVVFVLDFILSWLPDEEGGEEGGYDDHPVKTRHVKAGRWTWMHPSEGLLVLKFTSSPLSRHPTSCSLRTHLLLHPQKTKF